MKEAAGEANLTVVAIILIGLIAGVATTIVTNMMDDTQAKAECMSMGFTEGTELDNCIKEQSKK